MKKNFSGLEEGDIIIVSWIDPKSSLSGHPITTKHIGFYFPQDKENILISNIIRGEGKLIQQNITFIPKNLITNIEVVKK